MDIRVKNNKTKTKNLKRYTMNKQLKQYAERLIAGNRKRESFMIGEVGYESIKLPPFDEYRTLMKLTYKVTKSIMPVFIPAYAMLTKEGIDLNANVDDLIKSPIFLELLENLDKVNEDDLSWVMEVSYAFTARIDHKTPLDPEWVLENHPQHYFLIMINFIKINLGRLLLGENKQGKPEEDQEMQLRV